MYPNEKLIQEILVKRLKEIYGKKYQKIEVTGIMQYPMKEHLYVVKYNLDLENELPIIRAQIVVDTKKQELVKFDPGLL